MLQKAELHCHLDGLISPAMAGELAKRGLAKGLDLKALEKCVPVRSSKQWLEGYEPMLAPYLKGVEIRRACLELHVESLCKQGVAYVEIMVSGLLLPPEGERGAIEAFRTLRQAADDLEANGIRIAFLANIGRGPRERAEKQAEVILALKKEGLICGVAIAGDEGACTIKSLADLLAKFREAGLGLEIHAGETGGPESVRDALEYGKPDRIGHGVRAFEDEALVEQLKRMGTHIEFCPSSNLCLGVVPDMKSHPIARARQLGMNFSVNTDDPGAFGCSLESEFKLLEKEFGFIQEDFEEIFSKAMRSRFAKKGAAVEDKGPSHSFEYAMAHTKTLVPPRQNLFTFAPTNIRYFMVTDLPAKFGVEMRSGRLNVERPAIVTPKMLFGQFFEGFDKDQQGYLESLLEAGALRGLQYKYSNETESVELMHEKFEALAARLKKEAEDRPLLRTALIQGVPNMWSLSLMKCAMELTSQSFPSNLRDLEEHGHF